MIRRRIREGCSRDGSAAAFLQVRFLLLFIAEMAAFVNRGAQKAADVPPVKKGKMYTILRGSYKGVHLRQLKRFPTSKWLYMWEMVKNFSIKIAETFPISYCTMAKKVLY